MDGNGAENTHTNEGPVGSHGLEDATAEELINFLEKNTQVDPISVLKRALGQDNTSADDAHYTDESSSSKRHEPNVLEQIETSQPDVDLDSHERVHRETEAGHRHPQQPEQHSLPDQGFEARKQQDIVEQTGSVVEQTQHDTHQTQLAPNLERSDGGIGELARQVDQSVDEQAKDSDSYLVDKELANLRRRTIPALDNLSTQLLDLLSSHTYQETLTIATQPDTPAGRSFVLLTDLFCQTKKLFVDGSEFLVPTEIGLVPETREQAASIQRSNLATFVCAIFGTLEVGFYHLNKYFLHTFGAKNDRLLKSQIGLFLDLKTQAYISAMSQGERTQKEILDDLFPEDAGELLDWKRTMNNRELSRAEIEMVKRARKRREILAAEPVEELTNKYPWTTFLRDVCEYIGKNHAALVQRDPSGVVSRKLGDAPQQPAPVGTGSDTSNLEMATWRQDGIRKAGRKRKAPGVSSVPVDNQTPAADLYEATKRSHEGHRDRPDDTDKRQRAFTRKPWSQEEERTLLEAMEQVEGTHWAKILELHGPGGSQSEVLKDRSQVQLKDKARNLKMFFVRNNAPLPRVLNMVTGEYEARVRTYRRGPAVSQSNASSQTTAVVSRHASADVTAPNTAKSAELPLSDESATLQNTDPAITAQDRSSKGTDHGDPHLDELIQTVGQYISGDVRHQ